MATKAELKKIATALDEIANTVQNRGSEMGIPAKVANDFAYRCDLLADAIEKTADFDPHQIGEQKPGPQVSGPSDAETLEGEFTQEEFRSLMSLLGGLESGVEALEGAEDEMAELEAGDLEVEGAPAEGAEVEAELEVGDGAELVAALKKAAALLAKNKK